MKGNLPENMFAKQYVFLTNWTWPWKKLTRHERSLCVIFEKHKLGSKFLRNTNQGKSFLWNTTQGQSFWEIQSRVKVFGNKIQRLSPLRGWVGQMANSTAEVTWHKSDYDILYVYRIYIYTYIYVVGSTLLKLSHLYMSFQSLCSSNSFCSFSQASSTKLWKAQVMVTMVMMMTISILAKMALPMAIL